MRTVSSFHMWIVSYCNLFPHKLIDVYANSQHWNMKKKKIKCIAKHRETCRLCDLYWKSIFRMRAPFSIHSGRALVHLFMRCIFLQTKKISSKNRSAIFSRHTVYFIFVTSKCQTVFTHSIDALMFSFNSADTFPRYIIYLWHTELSNKLCQSS